MSNRRLFLGIVSIALACLLFSAQAHAGAPKTRLELDPGTAGSIIPERDRGQSNSMPAKRRPVKAPKVSMISVKGAGDNADTVALNLTDLIKANLNPTIDGLTINSVAYTGDIAQAGTFTGGKNAGLLFDEGIMLSTGYALDAVNGLHYSNIATDRSYDLDGAGDDDLFAMNGQVSGDAAVLTINFTPSGDQVTFRFRFGSEEWPTNWVFAQNFYYYDVFGFFVNGINRALIPGTDTPIGIDTIYPAGVSGSPAYPAGSNEKYYVNNTYGGASSTYGNTPVGVAYNGLTTVFTFIAPVIADQPNTIKIAIGDAADRNYDSIVFIEAHTFRINHPPTLDHPLPDQVARAGKPFSFQAPGNTFSDQDQGDTLSYSAAQSDGSPLPGWLSFNASTLVFAGTPYPGDVGTLQVMVTATDTALAKTDDTFSLSVIELPSVATQAPTDVTESSATGKGAIKATGGSNPTVRGFCWADHVSPTTADSKTVEKGDFGTGSFTGAITGLRENAVYHIRAYATNVVGTTYGEDVNFKTKSIPPGITSITTTVPDGSYNAGRQIPITINFSVAVSSQAGLAISLNSGATFSTGPLADKTSYSWTYTVKPGESSPLLDVSGIKGTIVNAALSQTVDPVPQKNLSASKKIAVDTIAPTAAITYSSKDPYKLGKVVTITATFSEAMADSPAVKIKVGGADPVAPTDMTKVDGTHYTYIHTVGAGNGAATVSLPAGADPAGNPVNPIPTSGADFKVDNVPPAVALTTTAHSPTSQSPIPVKVAFTEAVTGFTAAGLTVTNGAVGSFKGEGALYTFDLIPKSNGNVSVAVLADAARDEAGNGNAPSQALSLLFDNTPPKVTLSSNASNPTRISPIPVKVTFSEPVIGFTVEDVTVGNGAAGHLTGKGSSYTLDVTPATPGNVTIDISANVVLDEAGNSNLAASRLTWNYEATTISGTVTGQKMNDNATITPFASVVIKDPETTRLLAVKVSLDTAARGVFTEKSLAASGFKPGAPGSYGISGTAAQSTAAIRKLVFSPSHLPRNRSVTVIFAISADDGISPPVVDRSTTLIVSWVNHAPVADDQSITAEQDKPLLIKLKARDEDKDPLKYTLVKPPAHGFLTGNFPNLRYNSTSWRYDYKDSFTFKVNDGSLDSRTAKVSLTFTADRVPRALDLSLAASGDKSPVIEIEESDPNGRTQVGFPQNR